MSRRSLERRLLTGLSKLGPLPGEGIAMGPSPPQIV